jgi:hypothetical protein
VQPGKALLQSRVLRSHRRDRQHFQRRKRHIVGGFGICLKQKGACKSVKHERAIHESRARCNGGITFMNLTKMILASNVGILWGGDDYIQSHFTKRLRCRSATQALRR